MASHSGNAEAPRHDESGPLERAETAKRWFERAFVEVPGLEPIFFIWKKVGGRNLLLIFLFLGIPTGQYSLMRWAVYKGLPATVGNFGVELSVKEWAIHPLSMSAVARNVELRAPHESAPVFTAAEVEFKGSLWTILQGLPDMLTFHMFGGHQPFNEIAISYGQLRLERSLTGHLNWTEFLDAVPKERRREAAEGLYQVHAILLHESSISYVEHLPGQSGEGMVRSAQSEITINKITGHIVDLVRPESQHERPTDIDLTGVSADGVVKIKGKAAVFPVEGEASHEGPTTGEPQLRTVADVHTISTASTSTLPSFELTVYLDNIRALAFGKMVPVLTVVPVEGTIGGRTTVVKIAAATPVTCEGYFTMNNVRFGPNPLMLTQPADVDIVRRGLINVQPQSGPWDVCGRNKGQGDQPVDADGLAPAASWVASLNDQGLATAPPGVRALLAHDQRALAGQAANTSLDQLTRSLASQMGMKVAQKLGGAAGEAVRQSLVGGQPQPKAGQPQGDNPLSKGVKSVGSGIKRLFGGGNKK